MGLKFNPFTKTLDLVGSPSPGGSSFSPTRVFYVDVNGNDTTGDGSFQKPFATAQAAYNAAYHPTLPRVIELGVGSFGTINATNGWPKTLFIRGQGYSVSSLTSITFNGIEGVVVSDRSFSVSLILAQALSEEAGHNLTVVGVVATSVANNADEGYAPGELRLYDSVVASATSSGLTSFLGSLFATNCRLGNVESYEIYLALCTYNTQTSDSFVDLGGNANVSELLP